MLAAALLLFAAVNAVAWMQAGSMTHWSEAGERTSDPEKLGLGSKLRVLLTGVTVPRPRNHLAPDAVGLDYELVRFPNGVGDELEAWLLPRASAHCVALLFHGHAGSKSGLLGVAQGLHELGCAVLLVDFYGSGGSSGTGTTLGLREAHDVRAALEHCRSRWPERAALLYGQSMGGAAVLRAVSELGVRPDAIVLESTFDRLLSTVSSRFHRMGLPATPFAQLLLFWGGVRLGANAFAHNPVDYAERVRCPSLVLQGDSDPNISLEQARGLESALGGWSRLSLYSKTAHQDLRSSAPAQWADDLGGLLGRLEGEGAESGSE